jgi:hypothetical protein
LVQERCPFMRLPEMLHAGMKCCGLVLRVLARSLACEAAD